MKILRLICLALCISPTLNAQDQNPGATPPPLPPGPLIQPRAPEQAKWTIKITRPDTEKAKSTQDKKPEFDNAPVVTMIKSGKALLRTTVDRGLWQRWCFSDIQITLYPDGKNYLIQTRPPTLKQYENPFYTDYSTSDFPGFEWISLKNYIGVKPVAGHQCIIFKDRFQYFTDDSGPSEVIACIDYETRYPIVLSINKEVRAYSFESARQAPLTFPPIVQSILADRQKSLDSANRPR